jgi:hypothetical protein
MIYIYIYIYIYKRKIVQRTAVQRVPKHNRGRKKSRANYQGSSERARRKGNN